MKFVCIGYIAPEKFDGMSEAERNSMFDRSFTYDDELKKHGHWSGGEALQDANTAKTLRPKNGNVVVTDGPYAETKEQMGGFPFLEARDLDHAVELMSQHPAVNGGPTTFEIRAVGDLSDMIRESERRR